MTAWIDLEGLDNLRDLGGMPTKKGQTIVPGRLWRSDNLQTLTRSDVTRLHDMGLSDVIDLRSRYEIDKEGPTPLAKQSWVTSHWHSLVIEVEGQLSNAAVPLPDQPAALVEDPVAASYLGYISERPGGIVSAMRLIAHARGAALVHCAAGKDRTGTVVAMTLGALGVDREDIVADYTVTSERIVPVVTRMRRAPAYKDLIRDAPDEAFFARPEVMAAVLDVVDSLWGSVPNLLGAMGWTNEDQTALESRLLTPGS